MNNNASFLIILSIKNFWFYWDNFLLREKKYDLIIALLLDDSQSEYITAVSWQGDRATIQE
ncbi:hypothetical protein ACF8PD_17495 [Vibrio plantisponsor]|uniref:hypothetical protein n=1 Tax=Vibrio plantisponsor TaxID=664643 RepID=UPI00370B9475